MTYIDYRRQRSCEGKIRFGEEATARSAARDSAVHYQEPYAAWHAYECPYCGSWHVGHRPGWSRVCKAGRKKEERLVPRIRSLKPGFFRSRSLGKCDPLARLTFAGMWTEADDHGRGVADPRLIKGAIWALDDHITHLHVSAHIDMLAATGHIILYRVGDETYFQVVNWEPHQSAAFRRGNPQYPVVSAGQVIESLESVACMQESADRTQGSAGEGRREKGEGRRDSTADAVRGEAQASIFDQTPLADAIEGEVADESTSTDIAVPEEITAGTIVAALIDQCRARNIELPTQIIKRFGKQIKDLLPAHGHDVIWRAIVLMSHENVLDAPELLAKKVVAVQSGPRKPPTTVKTSATDEAVAGWLAMADRLGEEVAA